MRAKSKIPRAMLTAKIMPAGITRVRRLTELPVIPSSPKETNWSMASPKRWGIQREKPIAAKKLR